jgi:hypothetical protein
VDLIQNLRAQDDRRAGEDGSKNAETLTSVRLRLSGRIIIEERKRKRRRKASTSSWSSWLSQVTAVHFWIQSLAFTASSHVTLLLPSDLNT